LRTRPQVKNQSDVYDEIRSTISKMDCAGLGLPFLNPLISSEAD
jgi:hypothetical protein